MERKYTITDGVGLSVADFDRDDGAIAFLHWVFLYNFSYTICILLEKLKNYRVHRISPPLPTNTGCTIADIFRSFYILP